jgi:hypothetical protein
MFADPQTITVSAVPIIMPRVGSGIDTGTFRMEGPNSRYALSFSHTYGKRARHLVRFDHQKIATDPLVPTNNAPYSMSTYLVVDAPLVGYDAAGIKAPVDGLLAYLTASTGANITKLIAGES